MSGYLRKATASQSVALGPFISSTDFITPQTGLTIANTDIKLVVNGGVSANKNSGGGTHRINGVYGVTFDATDSATVGEMEVSVVVAGALPVFDKFYVIEAAVFDALFATSAPGYLQPATAGRTLVVDAAGLCDANMVKAGPSGSGTAQTARDIGASVLISAGTGTGQLDVTSGVVKSNLSQILGTALTETAGQIAAAFKKFFNIATPASTMDSLTLVANLTNAPTAGDLTATMKASVTTAATAATPTAAAVTAGVTVSTNNDKTGYALTAAYDLAKTPAQAGDAMALTSAYDFAKGTVAMTESYAAKGAAMTPVQALHEQRALLAERSIAGTTLTAKKLDGATDAATYTLDDAVNPSSQTRAT